MGLLPHLLQAQQADDDEGAGHCHRAVLGQGWHKLVELLLQASQLVSKASRKACVWKVNSLVWQKGGAPRGTHIGRTLVCSHCAVADH